MLREYIDALKSNKNNVRKDTVVTILLVGGVIVLGVVLTKKVNALENVVLVLTESTEAAFDAGFDAATNAVTK